MLVERYETPLGVINLSEKFKELERIASDIHRELYFKVGQNYTLVSEPHMAIIVLDEEGRVVYAWSINQLHV